MVVILSLTPCYFPTNRPAKAINIVFEFEDIIKAIIVFVHQNASMANNQTKFGEEKQMEA